MPSTPNPKQSPPPSSRGTQLLPPPPPTHRFPARGNACGLRCPTATKAPWRRVCWRSSAWSKKLGACRATAPRREKGKHERENPSEAAGRGFWSQEKKTVIKRSSHEGPQGVLGFWVSHRRGEALARSNRKQFFEMDQLRSHESWFLDGFGTHQKWNPTKECHSLRGSLVGVLTWVKLNAGQM